MSVQTEVTQTANELRGEPQELNLLLDWDAAAESKRIRLAGFWSIALHALAILLLLVVPSIEEPNTDRVEASLRRSTPLIAPFELTQRDPNHGKVKKEVALEESLSRAPRERKIAPPTPRRFSTPEPEKPSVKKPANVPAPEPPKIEAAARIMPPQGVVNEALAPPPQIQPEERPKLTFETPGAPTGSGSQRAAGLGRLSPPKTSVDEAVRSVARGAGFGHVVVGDILDPNADIVNPLKETPAPGKVGSNIELISDPMGVDFKPYLIRILSAVRRNWLSVIPESAKMGRRGRVLIQFSIDRGGSVPKLVIAMPSGAEPLDRAAVAGISASNPFPPLPPEFRGQQIRVQFSFLYNLPTR